MASKMGSGKTMMTPMEPCFGGADGNPGDGRSEKYELSQTYERNGGTVIPDSKGKIIIPGTELREHTKR